ncbi:Faim2, partial [Symbiodinium sp. KB8]
MPSLFALGQHQALLETRARLHSSSALYAFLDDIYVTGPPEHTVGQFAIVREALARHANIQVHLGKTLAWNSAGEEPAGLIEVLPPQDPENPCWTGNWAFPAAEQGVVVLGSPVGSRDFIAAKLAQRLQEQIGSGAYGLFMSAAGGGEQRADDEPVDPWAEAAQQQGRDCDDPPVEGSDRSLRGRRAWRRGDPGEPPAGANGDPTTGDPTTRAGGSQAENSEPRRRDDSNYTRETWGDYHGGWGPHDRREQDDWWWHRWSEHPWIDRSTTLTAETSRTTGWPRLTSTSTGRRLSSTTWGDYDNGYSGNDLDHAGSGGTGAPGDRRGGISEKTRVPVFAAEDVGEKLGSSARSYIRQIDAWSKLTRTPRDRQALLLYQNLQGRAWIEAWIMERYQEVEIGKIGEALNGFFKKLRRGPQQSIREFNGLFDRSYARLLEVDCKLPETARAWAYLNALGLTQAEELSILAVTNKLQRAAVLHEKSLRKTWDRDRMKPWERDQGHKPNTVHNADRIDEGDEDHDSQEELPFAQDDDEGVHVYEAYMTAKMQYKDALKARGLDQEALRKATEDKIALAKSKSYCSACKQCGHWHKDPQCPLNVAKAAKGRENSKDTVQTAHAIFETSQAAGDRLYAITDCACTKSVMGTSWLQKFLDYMKQRDIQVPLLSEQDSFRFGASRVYHATYAVIIPLKLGETWILVRAAVVHGDLPLLISRSALASLGMIYDMDSHVADFKSIGVKGFPLEMTTIPLCAQPKAWDASKCIHGDIQIVARQQAYMVETSELAVNVTYPQIFYQKKLAPEIQNLLSSDVLSVDGFVRWWQTTGVTADFWLETETSLIRVHVIPRKSHQTTGERSNHFFAITSIEFLVVSEPRMLLAVDHFEDFRPFTTCGRKFATLQSRVINVCGSAVQCSIVENFAIPAPLSRLRRVMAQRPTWQLTRTELLAEATAMGLSPLPEWTNVELRSAITEAKDEKKKGAGLPKGLLSMRLDELKAEAKKVGLPFAEKATRSVLMRNIRDFYATPQDTVMTIGKHKGNMFAQIPLSYGKWADEEEKVNGANMHPDLRRYVIWFRRQMRDDHVEEPTTLEKMTNPEKYAVINLEDFASSAGSSDLSWAEAQSIADKKGKGYAKEAMKTFQGGPSTMKATTPMTSSSSSQRSGKRRPESDKGTTRMGMEPSMEMKEEIAAFVDEADYLDPENDKEAYHKNGCEKTSFTTTTTKGSGTNDLKEDFDNMNFELGSEDSEDVVVLKDPIENFIKDRLIAEDFSHETLTTILESVFGPEGELFPRKGASSRPTAFGENDDPSRRVSLGYYGHGSFRGICHRTPDYASLSLYLKYYIRSRRPEARWTSMCISLDHKANVHTDRNNLKGTYNYVTCGGSYVGGGVWCESDKSPAGGGGKQKNIKDEKDRTVPGIVHPTKGEVAMFRGDRRRATEDWSGGHRWMVACFTSRAIVESTKQKKKRLRQWGYPVPDLRHLTPDRKTLKTFHDDIKDNPAPKLFPKYSTRKSMWKTAIRASGSALFEIGGNKQTLEIAGVDGMDFVEPLDWKDLEGSDSKGKIRDALGTLRPGVLWLHPPNHATGYEFNRAGTYVEQSQRVFYEILGECGQFHVEQSGTLVVEVPTEREELKNYVYGKLREFGEVTEHHFNDLHFYKVKRRAYHEALVSASTAGEGDRDHREPDEERPLREGASGITFGKDVKNDVAITLRRLHQNLGHPSNADLTRHLRLAGASEEVLKGSRSLTCETCRRCSGPKSPKPASEPKLLEFNDVVAVDMFFSFDIDKNKHKLLSMIDCASSYHVVVKVPNQTGDTLEKTFLKHWIQVFGAPKIISLDLETGIQDAFSRLSDWFRIDLQTSAGQAHWQAGFAERHGKWWKEIFKKVVEEKSVTNEEAEIALAATSLAKNTLRRKCGWAPCQIVFGKTPRDDEDIAEQEIDDGVWVAQTPDDAQHRRDAIRAAAKIAFMKVRTEDKVRRGSLQRARVRGRDLANGEMALFWRKDKNNKKGAWRGREGNHRAGRRQPDVKFTNLLARRALQHGQEAIVLRKINLQELIVAVFHDAGWANVPDRNDDPEYFLSPSDEERGMIQEGPWANKERRAKRKNSSVASQLGMLVLFTEASAVQGGSAPTSIVEWKSHAFERVCRSTFGAETMGCIEGIELAYYVRAMIASLLSGGLARRTGEEYPLVAMTDCRSLYDHFHKDGLPRLKHGLMLMMTLERLLSGFLQSYNE